MCFSLQILCYSHASLVLHNPHRQSLAVFIDLDEFVLVPQVLAKGGVAAAFSACVQQGERQRSMLAHPNTHPVAVLEVGPGESEGERPAAAHSHP